VPCFPMAWRTFRLPFNNTPITIPDPVAACDSQLFRRPHRLQGFAQWHTLCRPAGFADRLQAPPATSSHESVDLKMKGRGFRLVNPRCAPWLPAGCTRIHRDITPIPHTSPVRHKAPPPSYRNDFVSSAFESRGFFQSSLESLGRGTEFVNGHSKYCVCRTSCRIGEGSETVWRG